MAPNKLNYPMIYALVAAGILSRLVPHPANMALVTGAAIFAGTKLNKLQSLAVPLCIMLVSDLLLGFHSTMFFTWGAFALIAVVANLVLHKRQSVTRFAATTVSASFIFFLISNLGVWLVDGMYPQTLLGLITCYVNALPFFRNTLIGDALYTSAIFGIFEGVKLLSAKKYPVSI
jgi:hypothetical protein